MGVHIIKMPDIGEGIAEVELVEWHVQPGDSVVEDQILADVMTDKATVQVPSPVHGKVLELGGKVGEVMAVGVELIRLEVEGEGNIRTAGASSRRGEAHDGDETAAQQDRRQEGETAVGPGASLGEAAGRAAASPAVGPSGAGGPDATSPTTWAPAAGTPTAAPPPANIPQRRSDESGSHAGDAVSGDLKVGPSFAGRGDVRPDTGLAAGAARQQGEKPLASPAVRKRAWDLGIELQFLRGTGEAGRITHYDLDRYQQKGATVGAMANRRTAAYAPSDEAQQVPIIGLRRRIAEKMQESKRRIPHFTYVEEIDVTELEAMRLRLNERWGPERGKLTLLPLLVRAIVVALREYPQINARYDEQASIATRYSAVHMGIAAQTEAGLMVPVLRHAEALDLWACAEEIARLAEAARSGRASRDELTGSTITLTSLGALGGIVSTPVINHPEVAIVGVNRIVERPVVLNGAIVARKMMNLSSSFDHRVVDGMHAAQFVQCIRGLLECPGMLFVE